MNNVVDICSDLIRFDTTNFETGNSHGESECVRYIADLLTEAGYEITYLESAPTRANLVVRVAGTHADLPGVLAHAHLDVVPAKAEDWTFEPFSGEIRDGFVHGRGAMDMKNLAAALVSVLLNWADTGRRPERDVVVAFVADEEVGGEFGAQWLVDRHPQLFAGVKNAIGEAGGEQIPWPFGTNGGAPVNFYPVSVAERDAAHLRLTARGRAGHGSRTNPDNAVMHLVGALSRIDGYRWPIIPTDTMTSFLKEVSATTGLDLPYATEDDVEATLAKLGPLAHVVERTFRISTIPTVLRAGYKTNVVPETATAEVDVRLLPATEDSTLAVIDELLGDNVTREFIAPRDPDHHTPAQAPIGGEFYNRMSTTLSAVDPAAVMVPFCTGGGTDRTAFSQLGIACYGFSPSCRSETGIPGGGEHGIDERVPMASLHFAVQVLDTLLTAPAGNAQ
ncbi:M20/M25/M40 family metallo-hydrolase [Arthrobacter pigmenti]